MDTGTIFEHLDALGVQTQLTDDGKLRFTPGDAVPDSLRSAIISQRAALVAALRTPMDPDAAVSEAELVVRESERLGRKLAVGSIPAVTCGLTGLWCQLCAGMPCRGSSSG